jgi:hypothetical protein
MAKKMLICFVGLSLVVFLFSCTKLPEAKGPIIIRDFGMETFKLGDTIPLKWGNLIAVTNSEQYPAWTWWWFQDKEGNIYMAQYNMQRNVFAAEYKFMKRR